MSASTVHRIWRAFSLQPHSQPIRNSLRRCAPPVRKRILAVALEVVGNRGLEELSLDHLAHAAAVSRASLYRLFPGKRALFKALMEAYSPWEAVAAIINAMPNAHPRKMAPALARAIAGAMHGRIGLLLRIVVKMTNQAPGTDEGMRNAATRGLPMLVRYLNKQMVEGRLRRMDPMVAFQLLEAQSRSTSRLVPWPSGRRILESR